MGPKTMNPLAEAIAASTKAGRIPVMTMVQSPQVAAMASKVVSGRYPANYNADGTRQAELPNILSMRETAQYTSSRIIDNQTTMQLLPDIELAAQILIASILSPKDLVTTEVTYVAPDGLLPPAIAAALCGRMKTYFETNYKIKDILPRILRDSLFETGSYPVAVIPENSLDAVINGVQKVTTESLGDYIDPSKKTFIPLGILGPSKVNRPTVAQVYATVSLEDYDGKRSIREYDQKMALEDEFKTGVDNYTSVTDNYNLLKLPMLSTKIRGMRISSLTGVRSLESEVGDAAAALTDRTIASALTRGRSFTYQPMTQILPQEQLNRRTVGNPLVLHLPSESVIPVFVPGRPEKHVGYFVLVDEEGNPLAHAEEADYYTQLSNRLQNGSNFASNLLQKVKANMIGFDVGSRDHLDYAARVYGSMIDRDLLNRLRNGVYGSGVEISSREEVYRMMLSRALAQKNTQVLYIPCELMTYFAFKHTKQGIGKSLLDDLKIVNSLRTMTMFANVMAAVKNSIGRTEVKIKLDEDDPDPQRTLERVMHETLRSRQQGFPVGCSNPADVVDYLGRAGFEFTWEGHPGMPDVGVDFGEKSSNMPKPDTELEEMLKKQSIYGVGISPESIDAAYQSELATSLVANNLLLSKRVVIYQDLFKPQISDHVRKVTMSCGVLMADLEKILVDNKDKLVARYKKRVGDEAVRIPEDLIIKQTLNEFVSNFEVMLPRPDSVTLENQLTAMETYEKGIDAGLNQYLSTDFMNGETAGDISQHIDTFKAVIKAQYMRRYMAENGVMTELSELITADEDGMPTIDIYGAQADHVTSITKSLAQFLKRIEEIRAAANVVEQNRVEKDNSNGGGATSTASDSSADGGSDAPDDSLGGDFDFDMGGGADAGLDETPVDESTQPTEETPAEGSTSGPESSEEETPSGEDKTE